MTKQEELYELYQIRNSLINTIIVSGNDRGEYTESYYNICDRITELESNGGMSSDYKGIAKGNINQ